MSQKRLHIFVYGKVQGVGYRAFIQSQAKNLKVFGWVKNLSDGRVEIMAEADEVALGEFLNRVTSGTKTSEINDVAVDELEATGEFHDFIIQ